jgi:DNA primase
MALGGAQGLTPALVDHLRAGNVKELVLCLDGDEAGRQGAQQLATRLAKEGLVRSLLTDVRTSDLRHRSPKN